MKIMELDASFFGFEQKYSVYGLYTYTEDWQEYPDYSSDPPVNQGDFLPIIDNPDRNKYYPITISGQNYKIYNSAVLNIDSGIYFCIISDYPWNSYQLWHDGRQSGEAWVQYQSNNSLVQNGIYTCSDYEDNAFLLDSNGFIYNPGSYLTKDIITLNSFGTDLPVFTDIQSYMDYITNPLISASVKLTYYIPAGDYQYTKLTYKKDTMPVSVNDGRIVNLDPTQTEVIVEGLQEGEKYWFAIYTDKNESEPKDYFIGDMPVPEQRFTIAKKFVNNMGTFNYSIPSWMEQKIIDTLESNPATTTIRFTISNFPEIADLYDHQFVEYPLQFRTDYNTYPETGSRPTVSYYTAKNYRLQWLWTSGNVRRDETDSYNNGSEWIDVFTQSASYSIASSSYKSLITIIYILDNEEKRGYPALFYWAYFGKASNPTYQCSLMKVGNTASYDNLAAAVYDALK